TINFANGSKLVVNGTLNNSGTLSGVEGASVVVDSAGTMSGTYSNFYDATETAITSIVAGTYNWNTTLNGWELAA
ncbi:MAG: hypothetical protein PHY11_03780, partial [Bacilli bacterium]|nr:hypothetical protein [Bacilli bacterium]MDD4066094.1 hypothetical protein [Bacilli bacterium]